MTNLNNKMALIVGKSVYTMEGIAHELQASGIQIIFGHAPADADAIAQIATPLKARTVALSLNDPDVLDTEIASLGPINVVIIAPGWFKQVSFLNSTPDNWDSALQDNFEYSTYIVRAAGKYLKTLGRGGSIVVLSSVVALTSLVDLSVVSTSLAALHVVARLAAVELAPYGITVNVVAMGWILNQWSNNYLNEATQSLIEQAIPMQRLGTFSDVADVFRLLASDEARYITGAVLSVDGGYGLHKASVPSPPRSA